MAIAVPTSFERKHQQHVKKRAYKVKNRLGDIPWNNSKASLWQTEFCILALHHFDKKKKDSFGERNEKNLFP